MKIVFALGNPGAAYDHTRHNTGFFIIDHFAKKWGVSFSHKAKFHADIAETMIGKEKVLLVKPVTFYNETGRAARTLLDFYKLQPDSDFLVIHDELALPLGTIKTRHSGSDAGNNGIKSLNAHLGSDYARIRVGIHQPLRDLSADTDFVLGKFSREEQATLQKILPIVEQFVTSFIAHSLKATKVTH